MKRHHRLISAVLSVLMITSAFTVVPTFAAELQAEQSVGGDLPASGSTANCRWTFNESTGVFIITGNGEMDLDKYFMSGNTKVKEIIIGNGITSISPYAFYAAYGLKKVTIPYSVEKIGNYAFEFCKDLETVVTDQTGMSKLKTIGGGAFYGCESLKSFNMNQGLTSISYSAFVNTGITTFVIPESVKTLGDNCIGFNYENSEYTKVEETVIYGVRDTAAEAYANTHEFTFYGTTWEFNTITGVLNIYGKGEMELPQYWMDDIFENAKDVTRIIIDDRITTVSAYAFYYGTAVDTVFLPENLTKIKPYAFEFCQKLKNLTLPQNTKSIGSGAFYGCTALNKLTINDGLKTISDSAFANTGLTSVKIPASVTGIGSHALGYTYQNKTYTKVDGFTIYGDRGTEAERYANANGFRFVANMYVEKVNVSFMEPEAEETVSFDVYKDNANCDFLTTLLVQHGTGLEFCYYKDDIATYMKPGEKFEPNEQYTAYVWMTISKDNTFFDDDVTVNFNGKEAKVTRYSSALVCASYEFTTLDDYIPCDVNGNKYVDIGDATEIQYYLADLLDEPFTETQRKAADANENGGIDIGDATTIQYILADLI